MLIKVVYKEKNSKYMHFKFFKDKAEFEKFISSDEAKDLDRTHTIVDIQNMKD